MVFLNLFTNVIINYLNQINQILYSFYSIHIGSSYFKCSSCGKDLKGGKTEIQRHNSKQMHRKNMKSVIHNENVDVYTEAKRQEFIKTQAKKNEIRLVSFIIEHNLPIAIVDHLVQLITG